MSGHTFLSSNGMLCSVQRGGVPSRQPVPRAVLRLMCASDIVETSGNKITWCITGDSAPQTHLSDLHGAQRWNLLSYEMRDACATTQYQLNCLGKMHLYIGLQSRQILGWQYHDRKIAGQSST